ncbi:serine hydrolase domain-containing protein [Sulfidibacter corallicola]|uniref:Beta-lactamase family protein n=1 Tax=Sulfidibacter corallicola TaxID=2818388 RepID=A0A8A4TH23_SULCO|nr:serine hydrolase domain-containing protein [Sulfidibacter corallicola]QTD48472.1 beta-lactamase family protein [Sulfidibacter corallicola]
MLFSLVLFGQAPTHAQERRIILPHFTFADGAWETRLSLVNPDPQAATVTIQAYGESGTHLGSTTLSLANLEGSDQAITELFPQAPESKGWLDLTTANENLSGLMRFTHVSGGGTSSLPLMTQTGTDWLLPLLQNDEAQQSGFAVTNTGETTVTLTLTLAAHDKSFRESITRTVPPHGKLVAMAADLFGDNVPEKANLTLNATGDVAAFALTFRNDVSQIVAVPGSRYVPATDEMGDYIRQKMATGNIPGLGAAIVVNGKVAWTGGYGLADVTNDRPVTAETPFLLASISKAITGVIFMKAWENDLIAIEAPINDILPFRVDNPWVAGETILASHLLTHTSGIVDNEDVTEESYTYGADSPIALGTFLAGYLTPGGQWYDEEVNFLEDRPGDASEYSNVGTALVGYLIERVSETPFATYCKDQVFTPLGLDRTGWFLADFNPADVAIPYEVAANGQFQAVGHYGFPDYPNGQCRASAADLARFLAMVMNGGTLDGTRVLRAETIQTMLADRQVPQGQDDEDTVSQGLLWFTTRKFDQNLVGHDGGESGADTFMFFNPDTGIGVITLVNGDGDGLDPDALDDIQERLFSHGATLKRRAR